MVRRIPLCLLTLAFTGTIRADEPAKIDFNTQIRPILSNACFSCHGPDEQERKAKLRLDSFAGATAKLRRAGHGVVPGRPDQSELLRRILSDDPGEKMPPERVQKHVTPQQAKLIEQWIREGAKYSEHWAFVPPERPALPAIKQQGWARNPIDRFILARLEREGMKPSPEADRATLVRRLSLDLTGLPPTVEEVDTFLGDKRPDAYEKLVERLLTSPHYGERLAVDWLDAARFADTHGFHIDAGRDMSRWREYVIDAFQTNLPFDRFTIEQIAGDLLPGATVKQKVASGFNRNHMINFEGGAIPEEYHNAYVVDRVNTTSTVWLGLTIGCAQCHDHKYDPISQREFYQLYAFFHNVAENGLDGARGNAPPLVRAPTLVQERQMAAIDLALKDLDAKLHSADAKTDVGLAEWEKDVAANKAAWTVVEPRELAAKAGATLALQPDKSVLAAGPVGVTESYQVQGNVTLGRLTGLRLEVLPHDGPAGKVLGRSSNGNFVLTKVTLKVNGKAVALKSATADFSQVDYPVSNVIERSVKQGWATFPNVHEPNIAVFTFAPINLKEPANVSVDLDFQSSFAQHQFARFRLAVTDAGNPQDKLPDAIGAIVRTPAAKRTPAQIETLRGYYRSEIDPATANLRKEKAKLLADRAGMEKSMPNTMVMQELAKPRDTFVLMRGEYNKRGEKVAAALPAFLPPLPKDASANRLGLARWLVDRRQPLTSRVIVNRYWQMIFGSGLVKSVDDFGSQGDLPSHRELLDWLAVEFMDPTQDGVKHPWSVRDLLRMMVTSATYRQASVVRPDDLAKDKDNRLLARGPRYRLQAEFIRDQALAVSGLLNREIGGGSVSPYQPAGLWSELASRSDSGNWSAQIFVQSMGKDLYRRTMYTFWKRASPPPQLVTFDAPDREICTVRRSRTNTPLQALILMNDPTYVEASRKFAERILAAGKTTDDRIAFAFRSATSRTPTPRELDILRGIHDKQLARFRADPKAAQALLSVGESPRNETLPPEEVAAWSMVASVILNLDEVVTKN